MDALGDTFGLTGVTVTYVQPGQGETVDVITRIVSRGKALPCWKPRFRTATARL